MTILDLQEPNARDYLDPEEFKLAFNLEYSKNYNEYKKALDYHRAFCLAKRANESINEALSAFSNQEKSVTRVYGQISIREILGDAGMSLIVASEILSDLAFQEAMAEMGRNLERKTFGNLKQQSK